MLTFRAARGCDMETRLVIPRRLRAAVPELAAAPSVSAPPFAAGVGAACMADGAQVRGLWKGLTGFGEPRRGTGAIRVNNKSSRSGCERPISSS
jgi:hypothetical protein